MRILVNFFKKIFTSKVSSTTQSQHQPLVIPRQSHKISRRHISSAALRVLYRLHKAGYSAYLVGGSVRDLLLDLSPKDFDIATDAHPEEVQRLFGNSYIIGRRFRLVHVRFGHEIIEVATFRGSSRVSSERAQNCKGMLLQDNVYGTLEDDVWRRDFTINALYYNIADFSIIDYTGGMEDLRNRKIRVIGDPSARYHEDPARMLRAIRLAAKLDFDIDDSSSKPIRKYQKLLVHIPPARLLDKMLKVFHSGKSLVTFHLLKDYQVFEILFPSVARALQELNYHAFLEAGFQKTDERVRENKGINSAFLFAVLLWCPLKQRIQWVMENEQLNAYEAMHAAMSGVLSEELSIIGIPRRFTTIMREIWSLQYFLENAKNKRVYKLFYHPRFRAAYDFLELRVLTVDKDLRELFDWWTDFAAGDDNQKSNLVKNRFKSKSQKRKTKRQKNDDRVPSLGE